jgi:hypothetical protein
LFGSAFNAKSQSRPYRAGKQKSSPKKRKAAHLYIRPHPKAGIVRKAFFQAKPNNVMKDDIKPHIFRLPKTWLRTCSSLNLNPLRQVS